MLPRAEMKAPQKTQTNCYFIEVLLDLVGTVLLLPTVAAFSTPRIILSLYDIWNCLKISLTVTTRKILEIQTRCWSGMLLNTLYCLRYILQGVLQLETLA